MAKETSILKLKGVLDGMSFYKNSEGHFVRAKGGIEKMRNLPTVNYLPEINKNPPPPKYGKP